jgi:predicted nucleic acid-binding protein
VIVADTSVWIDYLRDRGTPQTERLEGLLGRRRLLLGDLIVCELLRGARDEGEAVRIGERLSPLPVAEMVGQRVAVQAALHFRILRRHGVTIRNTVDLLIGTFCIANGHQLLHSDRDFKPMVEHLGLAEA